MVAARKVFTNYFQRALRLWIRIRFNKTFTKISKDVKLGKGKGDVEYWYHDRICLNR